MEGTPIQELIDELTRYAKTNPNARVRITDSPLNELEILSIYTDDDESVDFDNVWIDVGNMEEGCAGCTGCKVEVNIPEPPPPPPKRIIDEDIHIGRKKGKD